MFPACLLPLSLSFPTPNTWGKGNSENHSYKDRIFISAKLDTWTYGSQFNNFFPLKDL